MTENNVAPSKENESSPPPNQRGILAVAGFASFIIYLIAGFLIVVFLRAGFDVGFYYGCVNFFITLPFSFLTVLICRTFKLPSRFELLVAVLIGGASLICVGPILSGS